jgi:hypothetical protein
MSIEHIAPQRPRPREGPPLVNVGKIGNLLLVPDALNSEVMANKTFPRKKASYKKAHVPLDRLIEGATAWGSTQIDTRTTALATLVQEKVFRV